MKRDNTTTQAPADVVTGTQENLFASSTAAILSRSTTDFGPLQVIRTETVLSKLPIHNLSKTGSFEIQIIRKNDRGEVELRWEVSYSSRYGPPRQLAYKLDTIVVNRRIDEQGRPVPKVIRLGSLRDIARDLDLGGDTNNVRKALRQNAFTGIAARMTYRGTDGTERKVEADFTRYNVIFAGEKLPDGRSADCVYLILNEPYLEVLNSAPMRPLNYEYLKILPPAAQRFYEIVSYKVFAALKHQHLQARLLYSDFCTCSAVQRYFDYDHFKKQMYKIHKPHLASGYLAKINYEQTLDGAGNMDWAMLYHPGPRARAEFATFQRRTGTTVSNPNPPEEACQGEGELPEAQMALREMALREPAPGGLKDELVCRGISETQALKLLSTIAPGQPVAEQIQWGDRLIRESRGHIYNPPGFYVYLIRENVLPPARFLAEIQKAQSPEPGQNQGTDLELRHAYEEYKREEIEHYIAVHYPPEQYEEMVTQIEKRVQKQYRSATLWRPENMREIAAGILRQEIAGQVQFILFEDFAGRSVTL